MLERPARFALNVDNSVLDGNTEQQEAFEKNNL